MDGGSLANVIAVWRPFDQSMLESLVHHCRSVPIVLVHNASVFSTQDIDFTSHIVNGMAERNCQYPANDREDC
jgi:hypothetical protein